MSLAALTSYKQLDAIKRMLQITKNLFTPAAIILLLAIAWQNQESIIRIFSQARIQYLVVAITAWAILYLFYPAILVILTRPWTDGLGFRNACYIHINRLPARYIPGGIWHTVARFSDFKQIGLTSRQLTALFILENILSLALALLMGGAFLMLYQITPLWLIICSGGITFGGVLLVLSPYITNRFVLQESDSISTKAYIKATLLLTIYWLLAASVFALYIEALLGDSNHEIARMGGVYLFSWGMGYLAFFAPQGVGVFEFVAGNLMHGELNLASAAILIAGFRVVILCADILAWGFLNIFMLFKSK